MRTGLKDMVTATGLTIAGRLTDATSLLQTILRRGGGEAPDAARGAAEPPVMRWRLPGATPARRSGGYDTPPADLRRPVPAAPDGATGPARGTFLSATFGHPAGTRPYKLFVPSGYRGQPVPLILMLHGCTQSPDDFAVGTRMNRVAEEQTCIVVYPEQIAAANGSKCWNWFAVAHQQRDRGEPWLLAGLTRDVMARYAVDPARVYVAGLSAGGAAAAVLGEAYPDLYAAIGVHSGLACGAARDVGSAFAAMRGGSRPSAPGRQAAMPATIVFHGDADTTVHPANGDAVIAAATGAASLETRVQSGSTPGGGRYTRTRYTDADGRAPLEHWTIHGGGHAWAGGDARGSYTDPTGPDASREIVRFFLEHRLARP